MNKAETIAYAIEKECQSYSLINWCKGWGFSVDEFDRFLELGQKAFYQEQTDTADTPSTGTMTLEEAILHCEEVSTCSNGNCSDEHRQLAEWLKELKAYREVNTLLTNTKMTELAKGIVHKMIDESAIADDAYPDLRQRMHEAVERWDKRGSSDI